MWQSKKVKPEYRTAKQFASKCGLKGNPPFFVVEACDDDWTYSAVYLVPKSDDIPFKMDEPFAFDDPKLEELSYCHPDGERALLIGLNPRPRNENKKCSLEATRRTTIYALSKMCDLKALITVDIFAKRTNTTKELFDLIDKEQNKDRIEKEFIGTSNKEWAESLIKDCDRIVLGWGTGLSGDKWKADYLKSYRVLLASKNIQKKCLWFGANGNGSPRHPAHSRAKELTKIDDSDFERIFKPLDQD